MSNEANFERQAARKSGETIHHSENSGQLSMERSLKVFEAMLLLNKTADKKEFEWYHDAKKKYADKYLGGVIPDTFINSKKEAIDVLYEVTGQDFTSDFEKRFNKEPQKETINYPRYTELVDIANTQTQEVASSAENTKIPEGRKRHVPEDFFNIN